VAACGIPDAVLDLLGRCWDDDPADRPIDAKALADELAPALAAVGHRPAPEPVPLEEIEELQFMDVPASPPVKAAPVPRSAAAPARSAPPAPGRCRLATDLAAVAGGEPWAEALTPLGASPTEAKLAKAVRNLLLNRQTAITNDVARVLAAWADATPQKVVRRVGAADLPDRKSVELKEGPAFAEVPGLQVEGKLVHPPKVYLPSTAAGEISAYAWRLAEPELEAADIFALASGTGAPSFEFLRQVFAWADQPDHPAAPYARELVAAGLPGVQTVPTPWSPNDPRFDVARKLFRSNSDAVVWTLRPARVHADTGKELRRGRVEVGGDEPAGGRRVHGRRGRRPRGRAPVAARLGVRVRRRGGAGAVQVGRHAAPVRRPAPRLHRGQDAS